MLKSVPRARNRAVCIKTARSVRYASNGSGGYSAAFRRLFRQAKGIWKPGKSNISPMNEASQALKQFVRSTQDMDNDKQTYIKNLIVEIVDHGLKSPPVSFEILKIVDQALSKGMRQFSDPELSNIFHCIFQNHDMAKLAENKNICSLATKLFAVISNSQTLTADQRLFNGIWYFGLLRALGRTQESLRLLESLLNDYDQYSISRSINMNLQRALSYVRRFSPDLTSIELIVNSAPKSVALFQDAILIIADMSMTESSSKQTAQKFQNLVDKFVSHTGDERPSRNNLIMILDTCLEIDPKIAERLAISLIREFALPEVTSANLHGASQNDRQEELQYYELLLLTCCKFLPALQNEGKIIANSIRKSFDNYEVAKETWDTLARWETTISNSSIPVKNIVQHISDNDMVPDENTLNGILEGSVMKPDGYIDDILSYFGTLGVFGNVKTYSILITRAMDRKDIQKALLLFEKSIDSPGCIWEKSEYLSTLDRLLVEMAEDPIFDGIELFSVYKKIKMFTEHVGHDAKMSLLYTQLSRDSGYVDDIGRLLQEEFSLNGQPIAAEKVQDACNALLDKLYNLGNDTYAWRLFGYMNKYIKLPPDCYIKIMQKFCSLGRPDAALLIFKSYRLRHKNEIGFPSPGSDMYMMLFHEFGEVRYEKAVFETHAFFKMDLEIEEEMPVMNAILEAYSKLGNTCRAKETYLTICSFPPGQSVNNDTVSIMMRELTQHYDNLSADQFWSTVFTDYGLVATPENVKEFLVSNCSNGLYMRALNIARHCKELYGFEVNSDIIEGLYNHTLLEDRKKDIKSWAIDKHPGMWYELDSKNKLKHDLTIPPGNGNYRELPIELQERITQELFGPIKQLFELANKTEELKLLK